MRFNNPEALLLKEQIKLEYNHRHFFNFNTTIVLFARKRGNVLIPRLINLNVLRKSFLLNLFVLIAIITNNNTVKAQNAPAISYTTPQVFTVGSAISPLLPTSSGGAVFPANYGTPVLFTSYPTPFSIAIDGSNNVYTTNNTNGDLAKFSPGGTVIFTVNTGSPQASEIALDGLGNIYVSQFTDNSVLKYDASGTLLATITGFSDPYGIAFDASNNAYVANYLSGDILEIPVGTTVPVPYLTGFNKPYGVAIDAAGNMYVSEQAPGDIIKVAAGTLTKTIFATGFNGPRHLNKDTFGNIYVADYGNNAIKRINPAGTITTILSAGLSAPRQAAFDSSGNLLVADFGSNTLLKSIPSSYSIDTPLPAGLTFDTSSGQIAGTPTAATPITTYTITAYNTGGSNSTPLTITIGPSTKAPSDSTMAASAITGTTATLNGFTNANLASTLVSFVYGTDPALVNATTTAAATNSSLNAGASSNSTLLLTGLTPFTTYYYRVTATNSFGTTAGSILSFTTLPATNANLASLTTSGSIITPVFDPAVFSYNTSVNNLTSAITITPTLSDPNAIITINGVAASNGTPSAPIALAAGANTITATVTAQDGVTSQSYTLTVTKQGLAPAAVISAVATLSNLTASGVNLSPVFAPGTSNYSASTGYATSSVTINPLVTDTTATVTVNGVPVPKGSSSANIPLSTGANTITTVVTAQDGSTSQSYTLIITRQAPPSSIATLSNLAVSGVSLSPAFAPAVNSYTANASNAVTSVSITPAVTDTTSTVTVNGVAVPSGASSVNLPLNVGVNTITTVVTAQDGVTTNTYTTTVTRAASSNAGLANLTINNGSLTPGFVQGTNNYTANVANGISSISFTPSVSDTTATVTVNGVAVAFGASSVNLPLNVGVNTITTVVTAQDGVTTNTYTTAVTRAASSNAGLANLTINNGSLTPGFAQGTNNYTANVANGISSISFAPSVSDTTETVTVNGVTVPFGASSANLPLNVGVNTITTVVTAQDGVTINTYTTVVTRAASSNAALANLTINNGSLTPAFAPGIADYTAAVANATTSITLGAIVSDSTATATINGTALSGGSTSTQLPLNVGANLVTVAVTAQDGVTVNNYTVTITRAASSDAALSNLAITGGTLNQPFTTGTTGYSSSVGNSTASVTITPTASGPGATVAVNGTILTPGSSSINIPLNVGVNTITTVVTAQDGITTNTYVTTVTRAASSNATLANLSINNGALTPAFAPGTTNYTVSTGNATSSIVVTPVASDSTATVTLNGVNISTGSSSASLPLAVGKNTISTVVTAQDGVTTKAYTVIITRAASDNANLNNLTLNNGLLTPAFATGTNSYTTNVSNASTSVTITPAVSDSTATVTVNGVAVNPGASSNVALTVGANTIAAVVTAQDGTTTNTYTVTVFRAPSTDATLAGLSVNSGALSPMFAAGTTSYTDSVSYTTSSIAITPIANDPTAKIMVNGNAVISGATSTALPLNIGINTIAVVLTAQDGTTTNTYNVTVIRAPSNDASLASLKLSSGVLSQPFTGTTLNYTANVKNATASVTVLPVSNDSKATITINGAAAASGSQSASLPLAVGTNTITTTVTAQDGVTTESYTITVIRAPSADATLANLVISSGTLNPAFSRIVNGYSTTVSNNITTITVTPTTNESNATLTVNGTPLTSGSQSAGLPLNVGVNTISIAVTAQNGITTDTYIIKTTRLPSADATLADLTIVGDSLNQAFSNTRINYSANVPFLHTAIKITATSNFPNAKVTINGKTTVSGAASLPIPLNAGINTINILVTAQDGITTKAYKINVFRQPASANANLADLAPNAGTLDQAFLSGITGYTESVAYSSAAISLTPTASDPTAKIVVNGIKVISGSQSSTIALKVGKNVVKAVVTAQDGVTIKTYSITITRQAASSNAALANLTSSGGPLNQTFSSGITSYTESVGYTTTIVNLTPVTSDPGAKVAINGHAVASGSSSGSIALNVGKNVIKTVVTAENGTTVKTYTVTLTRLAPSSNAFLASMTLGNGTIAPNFTKDHFTYTASVNNAIATVTLTPTTADVNATLTVNGTTLPSGTASGPIALNTGNNFITVAVTAQDGSTIRNYTVTVTRQTSASSADASLASLAPASSSGTSGVSGPIVAIDAATYPLNAATPSSGGTSSISTGNIVLSPNFNPDTLNYSSSVDNLIAAMNVTPVTNVDGATITVNGISVSSGTPSTPIDLTVGNNTITTVVTALDGITTKTYILKVKRLEPTSADSTRFITFNDLGQKTYGDPDFDAGAVASTSEQVIYTNSDPNVISIINGKIHIIGAGTATITATLAPDKNYNNIPVETQTLVVNKAKQTISFSSVPVQQRGTSYTLKEATSSAGLPIIYKSSDSTIMSVKASTLNAIQLGSVFLTATQPGNANYAPAPNVNQLVNIQDAEGDQLLVHQAVSPNGDGVNDFLLIEGIDNYPTNRVAIMNLNGETIYNIKGYNNTTKSFDGHSNITGHLQQPGTYFYMIEYTLNGQTRRKTGYFILKVN